MGTKSTIMEQPQCDQIVSTRNPEKVTAKITTTHTLMASKCVCELTYVLFGRSKLVSSWLDVALAWAGSCCLQTSPTSQGQSWLREYSRPPSGTKHRWPNVSLRWQTASPWRRAQHKPAWQSELPWQRDPRKFKTKKKEKQTKNIKIN